MRAYKSNLDVYVSEIGWPTSGRMGPNTFTFTQHKQWIETINNWAITNNIKTFWFSVYDNTDKPDEHSTNFGLFNSYYDKSTKIWNLSPKYNIRNLNKLYTF